MSLQSFSAFALTRAEMKNHLGSESGGFCTGTCRVRNGAGNEITVTCVYSKKSGCNCGVVTSQIIKNNC